MAFSNTPETGDGNQPPPALPPRLPDLQVDSQHTRTLLAVVFTVLLVAAIAAFLIAATRESPLGSGSKSTVPGGLPNDTGGEPIENHDASTENNNQSGEMGVALAAEPHSAVRQKLGEDDADASSTLPPDAPSGEEGPAEAPNENPMEFYTLGANPNKRTAAPRASEPQQNPLAGRNKRGRGELARAHGGNRQSERAVELALKWLAAHQESDGGWDFDHGHGPCGGRCPNPGSLRNARNGATAMALLPFLGAGETHQAGKYQGTVKNGIDFLLNGFSAGREGRNLVDSGNMYSHGLASIVLSEAYAMTQDDALRDPAQTALDYIVFAQDPVGGGWRYSAKQRGDTSVVGWQIIALKSGQLGYLSVDRQVFEKADIFLDSVQADGGACYGYLTPAKSPGTSAIGLLCRMYLGWDRNNPALKRGVQNITEWGPSTTDMYYNYYAAQLVFQYTNARGAMWGRWNRQLRDYLIEMQDQEGHAEGSWVMRDPHGGSGGRLYCTSLATLILEVYYRHMPIFQEAATGQ